MVLETFMRLSYAAKFYPAMPTCELVLVSLMHARGRLGTGTRGLTVTMSVTCNSHSL